jgi:hypothetical protein
VSAVNVARLIAQAEQRTAAKFVFSMASLKQRFFNEHLLDLFIEQLALDQSAVKNHPQFDYLRNYAAIRRLILSEPYCLTNPLVFSFTPRSHE